MQYGFRLAALLTLVLVPAAGCPSEPTPDPPEQAPEVTPPSLSFTVVDNANKFDLVPGGGAVVGWRSFAAPFDVTIGGYDPSGAVRFTSTLPMSEQDSFVLLGAMPDGGAILVDDIGVHLDGFPDAWVGQKAIEIVRLGAAGEVTWRQPLALLGPLGEADELIPHAVTAAPDGSVSVFCEIQGRVELAGAEYASPAGRRSGLLLRVAADGHLSRLDVLGDAYDFQAEASLRYLADGSLVLAQEVSTAGAVHTQLWSVPAGHAPQLVAELAGAGVVTLAADGGAYAVRRNLALGERGLDAVSIDAQGKDSWSYPLGQVTRVLGSATGGQRVGFILERHFSEHGDCYNQLMVLGRDGMQHSMWIDSVAVPLGVAVDEQGAVWLLWNGRLERYDIAG